MTRSKKIFIFLLAIAFIGSAIYIYSSLKTAKAYTFTIPKFDLKNLSDNLKIATDKVKTTIGSLIEKKVQDTIDSSSKSFKQNTFEFLKENMNNGIDAAGKAMGVDISISDDSGKNQLIQQQNCQN